MAAATVAEVGGGGKADGMVVLGEVEVRAEVGFEGARDS